MSYYYKHEYGFSTHSIQRIRQRLKLADEEEFKLKDKILKMIEKSTLSFETSKHIYIKTSKTDIYFVIDKFQKVIITATPISAAKQLWLIENE
ncbi:hypothetical protein [Spiroplasma diminutum]|uniref:Uncharacterized protein n=1 Tax=Spiroplasma diminutum CUAS-1 TaxID=1276221 RepID=S5M268_9MOLU|nr:hypothetical protein [Spiroplasma diminutum]AGR42162.1 hypothetical protein SDIMI_v3c04580 [Spiroplasma diminutum CUAS-1]